MIEIVTVKSADFEAIQHLAREIWYAHFLNIITPQQIEYMLPMMYASKVMRKEIESDGIVYKKVLQAQSLVGYLSYGPHVVGEVMKLYKCYLHPSLHGQGYGQTMLQYVRDTARDLGYPEVILSVNKHNHKAIAAYKRFGFIVTSAVTTDIGGGFVMDDYVLSYKLNFLLEPRR